MKHIKYFNESKYDNLFSQDEIDDILDVFQDILDDYSLPKWNEELKWNENFYNVEITNRVRIKMSFLNDSTEKVTKKDLDDITKRYTQMGYDCYQMINQAYLKVEYIILLQKKNIKTETKQFEKSNELHQNFLTQDEIDDIKDVLQDIIDEYSLQKFNGRNIMEDYYSISYYNDPHKRKSDDPIPVPSNKATTISIMISADITEKDFDDLKERYTKMGYISNGKYIKGSELTIIEVRKKHINQFNESNNSKDKDYIDTDILKDILIDIADDTGNRIDFRIGV